VSTLAGLYFPFVAFQWHAGVAPDVHVIGRRLLQVFYYCNTGGFFPLPVEYKKLDLSCLLVILGVYPVAFGIWEGDTSNQYETKKGEKQMSIVQRVIF
jgi:hypothetical protein